jgi:acyl-CoA dehydrogenase
MIQNNYFSDNEDLTLQFEKIISWNDIIDTYENGFEDAKAYQKNGDERLAMAPSNYQEAIDYYRTILESTGEIAGRVIAPQSQIMDHKGLKFESGRVIFPEEMLACMQSVKDAGILPYAISRHYGGLGLPVTAQVMMMEAVARADAAFAIAMGCVNLGETIESFASDEMVKEWVPKMAAGELWGAMALTEPNYGSDLQNVRTKAEKGPDGTWRITGTKRFITHGCGFGEIPSAILTLARTGSPESGGRGLSFFLVLSKDVEIAGIEKKMGLHISPTCEVVYDNSPALLIGEEGKGLVKYAMGMMNGARLSIAAQSMGIATAAYYEAKKYASERVQFGRTIDKIPAVAKMLETMEREIIAMRCLLLEAATSVDMYHWRKHRLTHQGMADRDVRRDEQVKKWEKLADFFTPLSKYYTSEMTNRIAFDALQIHGGSGYTEEYDVARIYRDARITNIYEGTTQLQIVAAIGGVVAGMSPSGHLRAYIDETLKGFEPSTMLRRNYEIFEEIVRAYREIGEGELKDALAFEVVESAARYINGLLLERSIDRLVKQGENVDRRRQLTEAYNRDSFAILTANLVRVGGESRVEVRAGAVV